MKSLILPIKNQNRDVISIKNYNGVIASAHYPLVYVNIPKTGCTSIKCLLYYIDNNKYPEDPNYIHRDIRKGLALISKNNPDLLFERIRQSKFIFTFVREPLRRVYSCFMEKIFFIHKFSFSAVREILIKDYNFNLPDPITIQKIVSAGWDNTDYGTKIHRHNFKLFLRFVEKNLNGGTPNIRKDAHWAIQSDMLITFQKNIAVDFVGRLETFAEDFAFVIKKVQYDGDIDINRKFNEGPSFYIKLDDILDDEIIDISQRIYEKDYKFFRYS